MLTKVISGGQTGADQAGLHAAKAFGLETGGWIPKGFRTDNGSIPELAKEFGLVETDAYGYDSRTARNVRDADGTVLFGDTTSPGTKLTIRYCLELGKPYLENPTAADLAAWIQSSNIGTLNVAGNRERTHGGIFVQTKAILIDAFVLLGLNIHE